MIKKKKSFLNKIYRNKILNWITIYPPEFNYDSIRWLSPKEKGRAAPHSRLSNYLLIFTWGKKYTLFSLQILTDKIIHFLDC